MASIPARLRAHFVRTYLSLDPRSLGLFRIVFGCALLLDLYLRYLDVDAFYTNEGLFPNHTMLWAPVTRRVFSFFFMASTPAEARLAMALCALVFAGLILGYRTRIFQVLALICVVSLNTRLALLENGGDIVFNLLAIWTVFLPLGRRFSLDALFESLRTRPENRVEQLAERSELKGSNAPVVSLASLAVILQVFAIYFFNAIHKRGPAWFDGSAVYYALHQDRIATQLAVVLREHAPYVFLRGLTYATVVIETLGALLVITPVFTVAARLVAVLLMPLLHVGFGLCLNLGTFSYVMAACFPLLVHERHWAALGRFMAARGPRLRCWFDAQCGVCFLCARVLARLDVFQRITFVSNEDTAGLPEGFDRALLALTIVVRDERTGRVWTRAEAVAALCRALPLGVLPWAVLRVPGLALLFGWLYDVVARNRIAISQWFGLAACGVPMPASALPAASENGPARLWHRTARVGQEALVAALLVGAVGEALNVNRAVPPALRYRQPDALQALVDYGRMIQSWRMFAPDGPLEDMMIAIEAKTIDGRLIDPYNAVATPRHPPPYRAIPKALGNDQFFTTYSLFIPTPRMRPYWGAFEQWILSHHLRTGDPRDRVISFTAYVLSDRTPKPGQGVPTDFRKAPFLTYPR